MVPYTSHPFNKNCLDCNGKTENKHTFMNLEIWNHEVPWWLSSAIFSLPFAGLPEMLPPDQYFYSRLSVCLSYSLFISLFIYFERDSQCARMSASEGRADREDRRPSMYFNYLNSIFQRAELLNFNEVQLKIFFLYFFIVYIILDIM